MTTFKMFCTILAFTSATQETMPTAATGPDPSLIGVPAGMAEARNIGISIAPEAPVIGGHLESSPRPPTFKNQSPVNLNPEPKICMDFCKCLIGVMIGIMLMLMSLSFDKTLSQQPAIFLLFMAFVCVGTAFIRFLWNCFCKNCRIGGCPFIMGTVIGITLMATDLSFLPSVDPNICLILVGCVYISVITVACYYFFSRRPV